MNKQFTLSFSKTAAEINGMYSGSITGLYGVKNISELLLSKAEHSDKFLNRLKKKFLEKSC